MRRSLIALFSLIVLFILFVVLCTFVRRPYENVLLSRFGHLILQKDQTRICYNWYLRLPTDKVVRIDTRLHLYPGSLQQLNTGDRQTISVQTYAAWRIVDPVKFYNTTMGGSDTDAQLILDNKLTGLVHNTIASHKLNELFNTDPNILQTPEMEATIAREATNGGTTVDEHGKVTKSTGMMELGIQIVQVGFSRMSFPPSNANKVYDRMSQEQITIAAGFRSKGEADASTIEAAGKADAANIRAQAVVTAEKIRGDADKEALSALAAVQLSPAARDFYQYFKSLDFVKNSLSKNTYLVLSTDTPWLKALFTAPKNVEKFPPGIAPANLSDLTQPNHTQTIKPGEHPGAATQPAANKSHAAATQPASTPDFDFAK